MLARFRTAADRVYLVFFMRKGWTPGDAELRADFTKRIHWDPDPDAETWGRRETWVWECQRGGDSR